VHYFFRTASLRGEEVVFQLGKMIFGIRPVPVIHDISARAYVSKQANVHATRLSDPASACA